MNFSVLLSVYFNENPLFFKAAFDSVLAQTLKPSQIILVEDGPLTAKLYELINEYLYLHSSLLKVVKLEKNMGLGAALNRGLQESTNEIVARMDTDDICYPDRFEKQLKFMVQNPQISVLGTAVQEFDLQPGDLDQFRALPTDSEKLLYFSKFRNPLNHPSVMFRKSHLLKVDSYQSMMLFEDYYLWVRLQLNGFKIANLSEPLLHFRVGNDMVGRRSGYGYLKKELAFLKEIKTLGFISNKEYLISILCKSPLRLLPKSILTFIYKKVLR